MKIRNLLATCAIASLALAAQAGESHGNGHDDESDGSHDTNVMSIFGNSSSSTNMTGASFSGTIGYNYYENNHGLLIVTLTNTTTSDIGGFLTGFVFDVATSDSSYAVDLGEATNEQFHNTGAAAADPFGFFDAGAAIGSSWSNNSNASSGLAAGQTGTFEFEINTSDASSLTTASFLGDQGNWFAVRFIGLNDGSTDNLILAPVPMSLFAGAGMLGLCLGVRTARRRG